MDSNCDYSDIIRTTTDLMLKQLAQCKITEEVFNQIFSNLIEYFDENNQKALFDFIDQVEDAVRSCRDNGKSRQDIEFEKYLDELDEP